MPEYVATLRNAIKKSPPILREMTEESTLLRSASGKWCPNEIIGHLIDSWSVHPVGDENVRLVWICVVPV